MERIITNKNLLIIGGNGNLGKSIVSLFKKADWRTFSIEYTENINSDSNFILKRNEKLDEEALTKLYYDLDAFTDNRANLFDSIINVAGGFGRSSIKDSNILTQCDVMLEKNYFSSSSKHCATISFSNHS